MYDCSFGSMSAHDPTATERLSEDAFTYQKFAASVTLGPDVGQRLVARGDELSIGTAPGNSLVLTDSTVSRHHCVLESSPRGLLLRDLGSTNGTRLGPHFIDRGFLVGSAAISLGSTVVQVELMGEVVAEPLPSHSAFGVVLGRSQAMRRIFSALPKIAPSDATVLIDGETGTGKTLIAEAIHDASPRADKPFMVVNCGAIATNLIESELFGHERGAFTGASSTRIGAFEAAAGGTIFLDEIGELPLDVQPKLLRVLESRMVRRVGGNQDIPIDARIIAATNRDLRAAVNAATFRADLLYRLDVIRLRVPPLRERPEDVPLLVDHFYRQVAPEGDAGPPEALLSALSGRPWPGNVRELRATIERAVLLGEAALAPQEDARDAGDVPFRVAKQRMIDAWEHNYLTELMARAGGSITQAARIARMDRNYLRERLTRLGVERRGEG